MDRHFRHPTYARPALPAIQKDRVRKLNSHAHNRLFFKSHYWLGPLPPPHPSLLQKQMCLTGTEDRPHWEGKGGSGIWVTSLFLSD